EINRTIVGVLVLRWHYDGRYDAFVRSQPRPVRLARGSFEWICTSLAKAVVEPGDLDALITSMVIIDLGKDEKPSSEYHDLTGEYISNLDHDMILLEAANAGLVRRLNRPRQRQKINMIQRLTLGSKFNFGQLA
ncbi:hypothetical protein K432DRAFT_273381, partial [Lepidopterella palustris CBS 459.81]